MKANILVCLLLLPCLGWSDERVLDYHSDILVRQDGWIEVTETIEVRAEGVEIRRGIYRDYPTQYEHRLGFDVEVDYEPISVLRDGEREDFHTESTPNGLRTYFGSAERHLAPGEYTYTYRYDAGRMLGFFDTRDELYWNVTGLGWAFPIDRASATVSFEFDLQPGDIGVDAFTGSFGEQGRNYAAAVDSGRVHFETLEPLGAQQGLTIVVDWPKGLVDEPGAVRKAAWVLSDNANLLAAFGGLLALFAWYIPVWRKFGRDPDEGLVVTRYEPPAGFSPASLRYIENMGYDNEAMTAAVVNLAVKGYLCIAKEDDVYTLERADPGLKPPDLAVGEKELLQGLFRDGATVALENENHELLGKARARHRASLKRDFAKRYFRTNGAMNLPAILIVVAAVIVALNVGSGATPLAFVILMFMPAVVVTFAILMKQPTGLGRQVLDEAAGFKDYLEIAEKDEMNLRNPPEKTPQLFERYLPFALAMGVDQQWTERFNAVFAGLRAPGSTPYHPVWYTGAWSSSDFSAATSGLTSGLGSAISSSVTAPGSSSGSGGGFSGGGGGGGGGGGW